MDEPLFGERKKQTQVSQIIISIIVSLFSLFSAAIGVYFGIKINGRHFVLVATIILVFVSLALLVRWWRDQDDRIHPKFKWLIFLLAGCAILASISMNCYAWEKQIKCNGLYNFQNKSCSTFPSYCDGSCGYIITTTEIPYQIECNPCPSSSSNDTSSSNNNTQEVYVYEYDYDTQTYVSIDDTQNN